MHTKQPFIVMMGFLSALILHGPLANAETRRIVFTDAVGDATSTATAQGDFAALVFDFEPTTGAYSARFAADPALPFAGIVQLNLHLLNTSLIPNSVQYFEDIPAEAYLVNNFNDLDLMNATTALTLSGLFPALSHWQPGHTVLTSSCGLPLFSGCVATTLQWDGFLFDQFSESVDDYASVTVVPILAIWPAFLLALLVCVRRGDNRRIEICQLSSRG